MSSKNAQSPQITPPSSPVLPSLTPHKHRKRSHMPGLFPSSETSSPVGPSTTPLSGLRSPAALDLTSLAAALDVDTEEMNGWELASPPRSSSTTTQKSDSSSVITVRCGLHGCSSCPGKTTDEQGTDSTLFKSGETFDLMKNVRCGNVRLSRGSRAIADWDREEFEEELRQLQEEADEAAAEEKNIEMGRMGVNDMREALFDPEDLEEALLEAKEEADEREDEERREMEKAGHVNGENIGESLKERSMERE